jgi:hypothetical protein
MQNIPTRCQSATRSSDSGAPASLSPDKGSSAGTYQEQIMCELRNQIAALKRKIAWADMALLTMSEAEHVVIDYQTTHLSLKDHPMPFLRPLLAKEGMASCRNVTDAAARTRIRVAGVALVRQRRGKGNAIFVTLEDETGITNIIMWARTFERYRRQVMAAADAVRRRGAEEPRRGSACDAGADHQPHRPARSPVGYRPAQHRSRSRGYRPAVLSPCAPPPRRAHPAPNRATFIKQKRAPHPPAPPSPQPPVRLPCSSRAPR